jgi:hypothetical protein
MQRHRAGGRTRETAGASRIDGVERLEARQVLAAVAPYTPPPRLSLSVPNAVVGGQDAVFTLALSRPAGPGGVMVSYATRDISARSSNPATADYVPAKGYVRIPEGQTSAQVLVATKTLSAERAKGPAFAVVLSQPKGAKLAINAATTRIVVQPPPPSPASQFQITVSFPDNSLSAFQQLAFQRAASRWSQIIVGDLPDAVANGKPVDDIFITATAKAIDGPYGTLGQAAPSAVRPMGSGLPYEGFMEFDSADVAYMVGNGTFDSVILHEMGHVLGLGSLWSSKQLVRGVGTIDPIYVGAFALAEYNALIGRTSAGVPVENTGGAGTAGVHWRESVFDTELMPGDAAPRGVPMPISRLTVAALQDLGYTVDYAAADPYKLPKPAASVMTAVASGGVAASRIGSLRSAVVQIAEPAMSSYASAVGANGPVTGSRRVAAAFAGFAARADEVRERLTAAAAVR